MQARLRSAEERGRQAEERGRQTEAELLAASTLASVSAEGQVPGMGEDELEGLEKTRSRVKKIANYLT